MSGILSSISGQFGKALMLGAFMPAAVFVFIFVVLVLPVFPSEWPAFRSLDAFDPQWRLGVLLLSAIVVGGLLYNLNIPLLRLYEGYPWANSWLGKVRVAEYKRQFTVVQDQVTRLIRLDQALSAGGQPPDPLEVREKLSHYQLRAIRDFPDRDSLILPTRLGNVVRSFERYSDIEYSIESISVWSRLIAKIDKDYGASVDDSKTTFDFMMNCSALSVVLLLVTLFGGVAFPSSVFAPSVSIPWLLELVAFLVLSILFYLGAVNRAYAWGDMVKGAFDLYRWDLLRQLGYQDVPKSLADERKLWGAISRRMTFGFQLAGDVSAYAESSPSARGQPFDIDLRLRRAMTDASANGSVQISLLVRNADAREAASLELIDAPPEGYAYKEGSAALTLGDKQRVQTEARVRVYGAGPYHFYLLQTTLRSGEEATVTYMAVASGEKK